MVNYPSDTFLNWWTVWVSIWVGKGGFLKILGRCCCFRTVKSRFKVSLREPWLVEKHSFLCRSYFSSASLVSPRALFVNPRLVQSSFYISISLSQFPDLAKSWSLFCLEEGILLAPSFFFVVLTLSFLRAYLTWLFITLLPWAFGVCELGSRIFS